MRNWIAGRLTRRLAKQAIVWCLAVVAFGAVVQLASQNVPTLLPTTSSTTVSAQATSSDDTSVVASPVSMETSPANTTVLAAGASTSGDALASGSSLCTGTSLDTQYLPAVRWQDFNLAGYYSSFLGIPGLSKIVSVIASNLYQFANFLWSIIFAILNLGLSFHPICTTASAINSAVATIGGWLTWLFIPVAAVFLGRAAKSVFKGNPMKAIGSVLIMVILFGGLMQVTTTAKKLDNADASNKRIFSTVGSVPWMADKAMGLVSSGATSLSMMNTLTASRDTRSGAFYDNGRKDKWRNDLTCKAYDEALYSKYRNSADSSASAKTSASMLGTLSNLWEQSFLSSWMTAQFGSGGAGTNELPSRVACRYLETTVPGSLQDRAQLFVDVYGPKGTGVLTSDWTTDTVVSSGLAGFMVPMAGDSGRLPVTFAWMWCSYTTADGWQLSPALSGAKRQGDTLCKTPGHAMSPGNSGASRDLDRDKIMTDTHDAVMNKGSNVNMFDSGEDDIESRIGLDNQSLSQARDFARSTVGEDSGFRLTQAGVTVASTAMFAWAFLPMSAGLLLASISMIILLTLMPLALFLIAIGNRGGFKIIKLTGAAVGTTFLFGLLLSVLELFINILVTAANAAFGANNNLWLQIVLALIPVIALLLLKKGLKMMGMGNVMSPSGAMGMMAGMSQKAVQDAHGHGRNMLGQFSRAAAGIDHARNILGKSSRSRDAARSRSSARDVERGGMQASSKNKFLPAFMRRGEGGAGGTGPISKYMTALGAIGRNKLGKTREGVRDKASAVGGQVKGKLAPVLSAPGKARDALRARMGKDRTATYAAGVEDVARRGLFSKMAGARGRLLAAGDKASAEIVQRATKNLSPEQLANLNSDFNPDQLAGPGRSENLTAASKNARLAQQYISKINDPAKRQEVIDNYVNNSLDTVRAAQHGALSPDGLNASFEGFNDPISLSIARKATAEMLGVDAAQIVMGSHGLAVPAPTVRQQNGAPMVPESASLDYASNPALYLDTSTATRQDGESDDAYSARITAVLQARGMIDPSGKAVDVFKTVGVDVNSQAGADRVRRWLEGHEDELLEGIEIAPVAHEARIVKAATNWSNVAKVDMVQRQAQIIADNEALEQQAFQDISDIGSIPVSRSSASAEPLTLKVATQDMTGSIDRIREAFAHASAGQADPETLKAAFSDLGKLEDQVSEVNVGLETAGHARASVAVTHYTMAAGGDLTQEELQRISQTALDRAQEESAAREQMTKKALYDIVKQATAARSISDTGAQSAAYEALASKLSDLGSMTSGFCSEEAHAAQSLSETYAREKEAFELRRQHAIETSDRGSSTSNRKIVKSVTLVNELRSQRDDTEAESGPIFAS